MEVCWRLRPIASATLMKRFAKSVNKMGSGLFGSPMVAVARAEGTYDLPRRLRSRVLLVPTIATLSWRLYHQQRTQIIGTNGVFRAAIDT